MYATRCPALSGSAPKFCTSTPHCAASCTASAWVGAVDGVSLVLAAGCGKSAAAASARGTPFSVPLPYRTPCGPACRDAAAGGR